MKKKATAKQSSPLPVTKKRRARRTHIPGPSPDPEAPSDPKAFAQAIEKLKHSLSSKQKYSVYTDPLASEPPERFRQPLSREELLELQELNKKILGDIDSETPDEMWLNVELDLWEYGRLAELPEARLLTLFESRKDLLETHSVNHPAIHKLNSSIVSTISKYLDNEDGEFFERIAVLIKAKRGKRPIHEIKLSELGLKSNRGRALKRYDLTNTVPIAVSRILGFRGLDICESPPRHYRITRDELRLEIRYTQHMYDLKKPPLISQFELSRWIRRYGLGPFMAKSKIAQKRA